MLTTKMHGLTHFLLDLLPTHGFSNGEKNLKKISQPSFRNGGSLLELLKIFCPEIRKSFDYFKVNSDIFFPSGNCYPLSFCSQFRIPWILL